jgi:HD superfamily phosphohydrolase
MQIVSGKIDADWMDYLIRDSHYVLPKALTEQ